jgi:hypothetical protein
VLAADLVAGNAAKRVAVGKRATAPFERSAIRDNITVFDEYHELKKKNKEKGESVEKNANRHS